MPQLKLALHGRITDHHRFLLRELTDDLERVENKIQRLEAETEIVARVDMRFDSRRQTKKDRACKCAERLIHPQQLKIRDFRRT